MEQILSQGYANIINDVTATIRREAGPWDHPVWGALSQPEVYGGYIAPRSESHQLKHGCPAPVEKVVISGLNKRCAILSDTTQTSPQTRHMLSCVNEVYSKGYLDVDELKFMACDAPLAVLGLLREDVLHRDPEGLLSFDLERGFSVPDQLAGE